MELIERLKAGTERHAKLPRGVNVVESINAVSAPKVSPGHDATSVYAHLYWGACRAVWRDEAELTTHQCNRPGQHIATGHRCVCGGRTHGDSGSRYAESQVR